MSFNATRGRYLLSTDPKKLDLPKIYHWLSTDAYWAKGRSHETFLASVENSIPIGVYELDGTQVAYGRVITDRAVLGILSDVYVEPLHRGTGLGKWITETSANVMKEFGAKRLMLRTNDAHGVYASVGFIELSDPEAWMTLDLSQYKSTANENE
jgi:GNAT superfamily N-acetyltransferase